MRRTRLLLIGAGLAAVVVLFLVLRPGGDDDESAAPATTAAETTDTTAETETETATTEETPTEAATTAPPPPPPPPPPPQVATIAITIRGGTPVGGIRRASVKQGRQVRLVVRADVADHVHLHGYDLLRDVAPGRPAQISFQATIPGRFEAELEDRGLQILDLQVRP